MKDEQEARQLAVRNILYSSLPAEIHGDLCREIADNILAALASRPSPSEEMVERLREALTPFAEMAVSIRGDLPDTFQVGIKEAGVRLITLGDLRRARDALTTGSNRPSLGVEEATAEIERLRRNMRMIVSHATCGHSSDIDASVNDICAEISRSRNLVYQDGKSRAFEEAAKEVRRLGEEAAAEPYSCEIARAILALSQQRSQS